MESAEISEEVSKLLMKIINESIILRYIHFFRRISVLVCTLLEFGDTQDRFNWQNPTGVKVFICQKLLEIFLLKVVLFYLLHAQMTQLVGTNNFNADYFV